MRFTINLATRRYVNLRRLNAFLAVSFLLLGGLLLLKAREAGYNQAEISRLRKQLAASAVGSAGPEVSEAQRKELADQISFANVLIDQKTVNWLGILDRLEEVVPPGVALTNIEPAKKEQRLTINGTARSFNELRALLENMERSANFSEVYLLSQNATKVGETQHGLGFSLTCKVSYR